MAQESSDHKLDRLDYALLGQLSENGRATHAALGDIVGLSSTAIARRQKILEERGIILGYQARLDLKQLGFGTSVLVTITLDSQSEDALQTFETAIALCPSVVRCHLIAGSDDYLVTIIARDLEDFERIHRAELSRLPRVSRIQSKFALREVVNRSHPPSLFQGR